MDQRNNYVLPKATTSWFQQGLPSAVSVVVDDDSLSDSCFEDTTTAEDDEGESSHLQNADQLSNYWNDLGSAIKFIDESTRSSVAAESSSLSPSRAQSFTIPSTELDSHDTFRVRIRRYSSLTTLTLSDNRSLIAASPDPSRLSGGRAGDIQSSTICPETFNQPSYIPLKSCLVDLDVRGYRVLSSCLSEPRQLSFNQSNYSVNQVS